MNAILPTSEVLNRAADHIQERGWTNDGDGWIHSTYRTGDPLCLEGGIQAAMGMRGLTRGHIQALRACPAYRAVRAHLDLCDGDPLYFWNDRKERTASEVIEVLRACAVIEASRERETAEAVV